MASTMSVKITTEWKLHWYNEDGKLDVFFLRYNSGLKLIYTWLRGVLENILWISMFMVNKDTSRVW